MITMAQWIVVFLRENLNRKPMGFSHEIDGAFRLRFSQENQSNDL